MKQREIEADENAEKLSDLYQMGVINKVGQIYTRWHEIISTSYYIITIKSFCSELFKFEKIKFIIKINLFNLYTLEK